MKQLIREFEEDLEDITKRALAKAKAELQAKSDANCDSTTKPNKPSSKREYLYGTGS
jgi:hypothetical protein